MPVYKTEERYLRAAIDSVLSQNYTDFEFLVLDDCPDDSREQIVRSYVDNRIRYIKNERNLGIARSRNKLVELAQGEYLAVVDHDDVSLPERFNLQVAYLEAHPECGVVGCKTKGIINHRISRFPTNDHEIKLALMSGCAMLHPSTMIRKSVLLDNNLCYEEEFSPAEDYALWCRLIPLTKFHNLNDDVLFLYRNHKNNTTHRRSRMMKDATFAIWSFVRTRNHALYKEFMLKARRVTKINFLGIPLFVKVAQGRRYKIYLFGLIPLISSKYDVKLQERT